ncbi:MAG: STAS domain-containing protein [Burkholderiales bacterium]|nr:STAS domain-containing protein [Burkholderiales bacterium]
MEKKRPPSGLLSKVAVFFRDSGGSQVDTSEAQPAGAEPPKEAAPQDLAERKRHDDQVRLREFNHLRKLRKQRLGKLAGGADGSARPSVFQSSTSFGADDRASTLKKIDVIEAHMVGSWSGGPQTSPPSMPEWAVVTLPPGAIAPPTRPDDERTTAAAQPDFLDDMDLDFTGMLSQQPEPEAVPAASALDTALQDAAQRFAQGQTRSAEALLLDLLRDDTLAADDAHMVAFSLFDLYRGTGQHDGFDAVAMDYARRFGRSPAEWYSVPDMLAQANAALAAPQSSGEGQAVWACPALLDMQALTGLAARFAQGSAPWQVDWSALRTIDSTAGTPLSVLVNLWCSKPVVLQWSATDALEQALALHTPADDRSADVLWWHLRLDLLRVLQRNDDFDTLALDYCMLYEVSPPSWAPAQGQLTQALQASPAVVQVGAQALAQAGAQHARCALSGEVLGADSAALEVLRQASATAPDVVVSCATLVRIDPQAAAQLVLWASDCHARGCLVRLEQVARLVAVLLITLDLERHAEMAVRAN